jgi:uncharacterized membrane protein
MGGGLTSLIQTLHATARGNPFLFYNTVLALIPLGLAFALFRDHVESTSWWWVGVIGWVLFLPNAPYVLTDSVHMLDDIRNTSNFGVYFAVLPMYTAFFLIGFASYVASLHLLRRFMRARGYAAWSTRTELALHTLCAVGIYLGRFVRLNSWDVLASPAAVSTQLDGLANRFPIAIMFVTFVVLVVGTYVADAVISASSDTLARVRRTR